MVFGTADSYSKYGIGTSAVRTQVATIKFVYGMRYIAIPSIILHHCHIVCRNVEQ